MRITRILITAAVGLAIQPAGAQTTADPATAPRTETRWAGHPYAAHVAEAARRFGIPEAWIWAVMRVESRGDPRAVSPAGAMGLMQLMPATWAALRARLALGSDPFDVRDNIMAGAAYLRAMHDRYGNPAAMLAAYNAGPGRYDDYVSRGRPLPAETRAYLARLAPVIDGAADVQVAAVAAPADPFAWRRAALFVRTADAAPAPDPAQPERSDGAGEAAAPLPSNPLFVHGVSTARPQ